MNHFIERCRSCHIVTSQCRCPGPDKDQRFTVCETCVESGLPYTNCTICLGEKPGVRGNEVIYEGVVMCDYCYIERTGKA
jgi:hypothetical protein